jgi:hypothetical protein
MPDKKKSNDIIIVSGLPRSGTSMIMKMLAEGGLEAVTDDERPADDDNPLGYFEYEPVKKLAEGKTEWLDSARGKVVKVISFLLEHLPSSYHYKVIFMERPLEEILASQRKMISNRAEDATISDQDMGAHFQKHLGAVKYWLGRQSNMEVLYMSYNQVLAAPEGTSEIIASFIGWPVDVKRMQAVPTESLYRNRTSSMTGKDR